MNGSKNVLVLVPCTGSLFRGAARYFLLRSIPLHWRGGVLEQTYGSDKGKRTSSRSPGSGFPSILDWLRERIASPGTLVNKDIRFIQIVYIQIGQLGKFGRRISSFSI